MCPNCILSGTAVWLLPGSICIGFFILAGAAYFQFKDSGEFKGDEEEAKYAVFED